MRPSHSLSLSQVSHRLWAGQTITSEDQCAVFDLTSQIFVVLCPRRHEFPRESMVHPPKREHPMQLQPPAGAQRKIFERRVEYVERYINLVWHGKFLQGQTYGMRDSFCASVVPCPKVAHPPIKGYSCWSAVRSLARSHDINRILAPLRLLWVDSRTGRADHMRLLRLSRPTGPTCVKKKPSARCLRCSTGPTRMAKKPSARCLRCSTCVGIPVFGCEGQESHK